jgi:hypothetical protein
MDPMSFWRIHSWLFFLQLLRRVLQEGSNGGELISGRPKIGKKYFYEIWKIRTQVLSKRWQLCVSTCTCLQLSNLKLSYHKISVAESSFVFPFVSSTFVRFRSGPCEAWPFEVQEFPRIWLSRYTDTTLVTVISNNIRHLSRSSSTNKYSRCMLI